MSFRQSNAAVLPVRHTLVACILAALGCLAFSATPALAREYDSKITGLTNPWGVTVDSNNNVWISQPEGGGGLISEYNAYPSTVKVSEQTGGGHYGPTYIRSLAVDSSNGYLYVADSGPETIDVFNPTNFVEQWSVGGGYDYVAVDNSGGSSNGRVYVAKANGGVLAFSPSHESLDFECTSCSYISGNTITGTPSGPIARGWNITVDNEGNIYVVDEGNNGVDEYRPSGEFLRTFTGAGAPEGFVGELTGVAVDPTNGNVLIVDSGSDVVDEFSSTGEYLEQLTGISEEAPFGNLHGGIAVNSEGYVYVTDGREGVVDIFTPAVKLAKVSYQPVTNPLQTSGTLNATVEPNGGGNVIGCHFEYGETNSYGHSAQCLNAAGVEVGTPTNPIESESPTAVHANVSGLTTETTYHYRIVATNANAHGSKKGSDQTFTPHAVSGLCTEPATNPGPVSATLHGCFTGNGEHTHYYFEWGATKAYGNKTAVQDAGSPTVGEGPESFSLNLEGLEAESEYHYRFVAENAVGTTVGIDQNFKTLDAVQSLSTEAATNPAAGSETLNGSYTGGGTDTHYYFEWGPTDAYGHTTPVPPGTDAGSGSGTQNVSTVINGLEILTTYHYRIVAVDEFGTTYGVDQTFFSSPPNLSTIESSSVSAVTPTTAVLEAEIDPGFGPTIYRFQYGTSTAYGSQTFPSQSIGEDGSPHSVSTGISTLSPGTEYHFRALAINFSGPSYGPDQTFDTPDSPVIAEIAASNVTRNSAMLDSTVRPGFRPTTYRFEYGPTSAYGSATPESASIGSDNSAKPASVSLSGLSPATTYHFRVVATNEIGTTESPDQTFSTAPEEEKTVVSARTCKKGFLFKHGKCVKTRRAKARHHKRAGNHLGGKS